MTITLLATFLIVAGATGTFVGLLISSYLGLGFGFENLKTDVVKCFVPSAVVVSCAIAIVWSTGSARALLPLLIVWWVAIKLCWLDIENVEIVLAATTAAIAMGMVLMGASQWFGVFN